MHVCVPSLYTPNQPVSYRIDACRATRWWHLGGILTGTLCGPQLNYSLHRTFNQRWRASCRGRICHRFACSNDPWTSNQIRGWCCSLVTFLFSWCSPVSAVNVSNQISQMCWDTFCHLKQIHCCSFKVSPTLPMFCSITYITIIAQMSARELKPGLEGRPKCYRRTSTQTLAHPWCGTLTDVYRKPSLFIAR